MAKTILQALNGQKTEKVPFWFMRQAGRYLPEYRELRAKKNGFMDMALDPEAACEITMQPIRRFEMSAAIIFSDILVIPYALGQDVHFEPGKGPVLSAFDFESLSVESLHEKLEPVYQALKNTSAALKKEGFDDTALIGFCGAPWTVATYMIEGASSKDFANVKSIAYGQPEEFQRLMDILVEASAAYLIRQAENGAEVLQIFDSWAGALDEEGFRRWVIEPNARIVEKVRAEKPDVPIIGFPKGAGHFYPDYIRQTKVSAIGLDSQTPTDWAAQHLQTRVPVQGNLDPIHLRAGGKNMLAAAGRILNDLSSGPFVFNLGHGIQKETPPEHVAELCEFIRDYKR